MFRISENIKKALNKTNKVIFLGGSNTNDVFYNDFYYGTLPLKDSIYYFYRREYKCDISLYFDINLNLSCFNKKTYNALEKFFNPNEDILNDNNQTSGNFELDILRHSETQKKGKKALSSNLIERLYQIEKFFSVQDGKKLLYIEGFEWMSDLFSYHMHNLEIIRFINRLVQNQIKDLYVVISLKSFELLDNYYFETQNDNFITIPGARIDEYFDSMYRFLYLNTNLSIPFEKLESLSTAFKTNSYLLKDACHVFASELNKAEDAPFAEIYPVFNKYFHTPIEEKIDFDKDLILDEYVKDRIKKEFNNFILNKPEAKKGIILTGSPGTGKTMIAKAVANMGGFNFMPLKLSDLKQLYVGHSGAEVKKIFEKARTLEPTIIFIDEMDAVFPKRDNALTDSFAKDITNEFIAQVDGVDNNFQRIFIIGATNIPEVLDSAVISRFDMQIIPLPKRNEREKLFELYIPYLKQNNWNRINKYIFLDKTEGLSGRDIKDISNTIKTRLYDLDKKASGKDIFDISLEIFKEKVISTNKDKFEYISTKKNRYNFNSVIGYHSIKKEIKNSIISVIRADELRYYNINSERGILLEGPPGNGKSFIAQCIAGEFNLDFIKVIGKDIASHFYSEDSKKLSDIFDSAFKIARLSKNGCVLFFDEFDGIAAKSSNLNLRATILDLIVKSRDIPNLILIAATNYKEYLDEATIREGRFDKKIRIDNPTRSDTFDLIRVFLKETDKITGKEKIENKITHETYDNILDYFDKSPNDSKSSIAGVKSFTDSLKRNSFFNKKIDKDKKLIIDNETVLDFMSGLY
jgi:transitional endoplasmic reticulum ATPase